MTRSTVGAARSRSPDAEDLARQIENLFSDPPLLRRTAAESRQVVAELGGATDKIMRALEHYIAHMIVSAAEAAF